MRRLSTFVVGLLVLASVAATPAAASATQAGQRCAFPVTMTDATGTEVTIEDRPDRVVTTNPSAAQTMWEIGGRDQVVGLTQYAAYLDGADSRTNVSASFGVSRETVVGTNPDLVIAPNASAGEVQGLRDAGLTVYHLREAKTIEDIAEKTTTIGRLTGNCQGAADTNTWMNANVDTVRRLTADVEDDPRVLYSLGGGYYAGGDTFIDALFEVVGADNVAARDHAGYPQLSDEVVLQLNPEVLVVTDRTTGIASAEPFASTQAGRTNSTVRVNVRDLNQPAPRSVVYVVRNMTRQLYFGPDAAAGATGAATPTATGADGPGFTPVGAVLAALVATALVARRRR
ncbi:PGF-CTERM-anchored ABC transporter substrate-binding protein [Haloarcula onubensis]|uniref:PGF-CTERM-anchored ABC transporter substrate-binding protein n=1 Tax=Haloarcula onubensis TaxID=2950539 RepID=A0ABU2FSB7_9EURY|nr:PGF-CTERM-anchored ABC transporter substrate-binding protein [Halomicroarcula sp. S3CR25-11]MDS0283659.1 PGF-CTERM-anchored ABC transporter substrate-binding protein [Halomicroarcula sp. S3CR25-11]